MQKSARTTTYDHGSPEKTVAVKAHADREHSREHATAPQTIKDHVFKRPYAPGQSQSTPQPHDASEAPKPSSSTDTSTSRTSTRKRTSPVRFDPSTRSYRKRALKTYKWKAAQNTAIQRTHSSTATSDVPINVSALEQDTQLSPDDDKLIIDTLNMMSREPRKFLTEIQRDVLTDNTSTNVLNFPCPETTATNTVSSHQTDFAFDARK